MTSTAKQIDPQTLRAAIDDLRKGVDQLPKIDIHDLDATTTAARDAVCTLADSLRRDRDAVFSADWNGAIFKMLGIRSTSTSGLTGAMTNWIAAAEKTLTAAAPVPRRPSVATDSGAACPGDIR